MCKTDNAREFAASCGIIGLVHEPTSARRWPHNAALEREIWTFEEVTRSVHLAAGFHLFTGLWKYAVSYAWVAMNQFHPLKNALAGESPKCFVRATGQELEGRHLLLGQLVYVRKDPLERRRQRHHKHCLLDGDPTQVQSHTKMCITFLIMMQ